MTSMRLESDRNGVPQYDGDPELFDEYEERAWDLWHGREGQDSLQMATPVHLRSGLSATAYEAVRKLEHKTLKTKDSKGSPSEEGMKFFLKTLKDAIAAEQPVKINEVFLHAFYSPSVWRKNHESMQAYIVRREQDFRELEELGSSTMVAPELRAMMLLIFGGLDAKEQISVLSSCNNEYDLVKIGHAMRMQFPNAAGKQVMRKDYLGASRGQQVPFRSKWQNPKSKQHVLAVEESYPADEALDDDVYYEDPGDPDAADEQEADAFEVESDGGEVEALLQDLSHEENPEVYEALATVLQYKQGRKPGQKGKSKGKQSASGSSSSFPFKAQGELSFNAQAKEQRKNAVKFLKSVTPCTSCGQKGHWNGDDECPNKKKSGKGVSPKRKPMSPKKSPTTYFVLHEKLEDESNRTACFAYEFKNDLALEDEQAFESAFVLKNAELTENELALVPKNPDATNDYKIASSVLKSAKFVLSGIVEHEKTEASFTDSLLTSAPEVLMVLKDLTLCSHSSYLGGDEKQFHRGANGHTRHVSCKEDDCNKTVITGRRKVPSEMWRYLVLIALTTKWGQAARSRELFANVCRVRDAEVEEVDRQRALAPPEGYPGRKSAPSSPAPSTGWTVVPESPTSSGPKTAKIIRETTPRFWLYGVPLSPVDELPEFPSLGGEDQDILQPLPGDESVCGPETPYNGILYAQVASAPEAAVYCQQVLWHALENHPMDPSLYRFAFYLFGRVRLVHATATRMWKSGEPRVNKRTVSPDDMVASRCIRVPLQMTAEPRLDTCQLHDCEVMMVADAVVDDKAIESVFANCPEDPPGLAILDSGCTKTMHGTAWAEAFEDALQKIGLSSQSHCKKQAFRGVGGAIESDTVKVFPIAINKVHGELHSAEAPGNIPLLVSRPFMEELGTVIDIGRGVVSFNKIGVKDLPLIRTSRGHLAVNFLDFDHDVLWQERMDDIMAESYEVIDYDGRNPDDVHDQQDWLHVMRMEVEGYERFQRELAAENGTVLEHLEPESQGFLCEDAYFFEEHAEQFVVRKATNKKSKKLMSMNAAVDGDDWHRKQVIQEKHERLPRRPPFGKVWVKQLFAGQMGLTLFACCAGLLVGVPLDSQTSNWDAATSPGFKLLCHDLKIEDPYLLVITQPCGPWGNWSRFNLARGGQSAMTVQELRESGRPILSSVNKTVKDRVKAKRHVFVEQPLGSQWLEEPELADVRALLDSGDLILITVHGCQVGYRDRELDEPHFKPSQYVTSLLSAESVFKDKICQRDHVHVPLEGRNRYGSRTIQASVWPDELNKLVLDSMIQQAAVEQTVSRGVEEAFPVRALEEDADSPFTPPKRRKRKGRVAILSNQYNAPPVYIRARDPVEPAAIEDVQDEGAEHDPEQPQDDASFRAQEAAKLDPILNITERERRRRWMELDPELRKVLRGLHVQFGHPTNVTLQRILRRQNAKPEALRGADLLSCDACGESIRRRRPKPVRLPTKYEFNHHLMIDVFYAKDVQSTSYAFLNIVCDASSFQVVTCLGSSQGPPASQAVLRHFLASWSSWAGLPKSIQVDRGKEYLAHFADYLKEFGVEQETTPLEAPWQNGKVERLGGLWKELFFKVVQEAQIQGIDDVSLACSIISQCRNSFPRANGYAPVQWVLGTAEVRLPGSLLQDEEAERLEVLEAANDPRSAMSRSLAIRESARVAQIRLDNDSRVRRALLHKSTPTRGPYPIGSYVYFYQIQTPLGGNKNYRWFGPARVIGMEARNPRRLEDAEDATVGGQPHSYWLRYGPSVILVTGEQLRFASEDELIAAHYVPQEVLAPDPSRGARNYIDLRGHTATPAVEDAPEGPIEIADVPQPDSSAVPPQEPSSASGLVRVPEEQQQPREEDSIPLGAPETNPLPADRGIIYPQVPMTPPPGAVAGDQAHFPGEPEPGPTPTQTPVMSRQVSALGSLKFLLIKYHRSLVINLYDLFSKNGQVPTWSKIRFGTSPICLSM